MTIFYKRNMINYKYTSDDSNVTYFVSKESDFEFVNPHEKICSMYINSNVNFLRNSIRFPSWISQEIRERVIIKKAVEEWGTYYNEMLKLKVPENLFLLLQAKSKSEQIKLLKGISLTSDELSAFILKSNSVYNYLFSQYTSIYFPNGTEEERLPLLAHIDDDNQLNIVGETTLSEGQIKQTISNRSAKVAKFLDNENNWHCFFLTYNSLRGEESYKNGQPHLHYISDKWGLERKYVVEQIKSKNYKLPSLPHIDFHTHRNPRKS